MTSAMNKLIQINLELMDIAVEDGINFEPRLGLGCLAFTSYIRKGINEILAMRDSLADYKLRYKAEAQENEELHDLIANTFGDRDINSLPTETLVDILTYAKARIEEDTK